MDNKDVVKAALAAVAKEGKELPSHVKEALKREESTALTTLKSKPVEEKKAGLYRERDTPIWPMDDEQLAQWRKEKEARRNAYKEEIPLTPERKAELHRWAKEHVDAIWLSRPRRTVVAPTEKKEKAVKTPKGKDKKEGRGNRLGQTKLIDELLIAGKTEAEIIATVKEEIPTYPADKIPKMIKLRRYHIKKK